MSPVDNMSQKNGDRARQWARQGSQKGDDQPKGTVFETLAHASGKEDLSA